MEKLTDTERKVLNCIVKAVDDNGFPPTVRDICRETGIKSTSTAYKYIGKLEEKGYLNRKTGKSRAIIPKDSQDRGDSVRVPIIGRVAAGIPILAVENHDGYVDVSLNRIGVVRDKLFALCIKGTSMIDAGIMDGDYVIVEQTPVANDGEIVVALIDDEATVKTFYREKNIFRLQPENKTMEPIYTRELVILGKVVACVRYY